MLNPHSHTIVILCLLTFQATTFLGESFGQAQHERQPSLQKTSQSATSSNDSYGSDSSGSGSSNSRSSGGGRNKVNSLYYYTRTRDHPNHLRVSEEMKNQYVDEVKYESKINGTKYEYYRSFHSMSYDELVYETIDKIFRHRLSPFYIHHYDREEDKRRSSDPVRVSQESCARDLLYLVEKLPKRSLFRNPFASLDDERGQPQVIPDANADAEDEHLTPELAAFFDSYARQEAGILRGNTYWVGAHDQCVNRHIFELIDPAPAAPTNAGYSRPGHTGHDQRQSKQQVVSFKGRYCVSSLKAPIWDKMIENKKRKARDYFKTERQLQEYSKLFRIQLGICLPDSCDSTAFDRHKDEIKMLAKSTLEPRFADYDLIDLYCLPDETSPLRRWSSSALGFIVFLTVWLAIILMASLADVLGIFDRTEDHYHYHQKRDNDEVAGDHHQAKRAATSSRLHQFVRIFSLRANYDKLMNVGPTDDDTDTEKHGQKKKKKKLNSEENNQQPPRDNNVQVNNSEPPRRESNKTNHYPSQRRDQIRVNLKFLNAFKTLIMFWIINGHIMLLMIQTAKNILDSDALLNGLMHFLIGATFGVDLFFTMTGFLTSYLFFNSGQAFKMKLSTWIYLSFHRYWRLAPMYILTFWFSRSVMQSLGAGPLWDYGTSSMTFRGLCNSESWWYPLTLTSNLHGLFEECMITSWYISCDMQFWLVSPLFIYLLARSPVNGWLVTITAILASSKVRYDAILNDKSARYDELVQPRADIFMRVSHDLPALYTHPHYRIAAYLVGLLAGHYVYMIKSNKWASVLIADLAERQRLDSAEQGAAAATTAATTTATTTASSATGCGGDGGSTGDEATISTRNEMMETNPVPSDDGSSGSSDADEFDTTTRELMTTSTMMPITSAQLCRRTRNTLAYFGLALFLVMASCSYLLAHYFPSRYLKHSRPIAAVLYSIDHLVMSVGASLIIVTMCLGQWDQLVRFLSHPNWTRVSKINYALLLLQCEAIYYQIFRYEQVPMAGTRELINILFNLLVTLYPLAFLATLVFEFPLANLEKVAMNKFLSIGGGGKATKRTAKQEVVAAEVKSKCCNEQQGHEK